MREAARMAKATDTEKNSTARVKADKARIDRLKEQLRSTPQELTSSGSGSWRRCTRRPPATSRSSDEPNSWQPCWRRKKLYIDDNLFVGSMASTVNGIYTYPEWNVDWMKEEKTVEKSQDPGRQEGEPVGARLLGQACAEAPDAERSSRRGMASIRSPVYDAGLIA